MTDSDWTLVATLVFLLVVAGVGERMLASAERRGQAAVPAGTDDRTRRPGEEQSGPEGGMADNPDAEDEAPSLGARRPKADGDVDPPS